jgi:hypothetical protein
VDGKEIVTRSIEVGTGFAPDRRNPISLSIPNHAVLFLESGLFTLSQHIYPSPKRKTAATVFASRIGRNVNFLRNR